MAGLISLVGGRLWRVLICPLSNADNYRMNILLTILGLALLAFGSFVIVCSYIGQVQNYKNRDDPKAHHSSPIPFFGPILAIVGLALLSAELSPWMLLFFLLHPDTVIVVIGLIWLLFNRQKQS